MSLNPWITTGHYDGGRKLVEGQDFNLLVGHDGIKAEVCTCPLCENWRKYYVETLNYYVKKINPETLWLEDDFRLSGKQTGNGIITMACFCDEHMKLFCAELGENISREEFVARLTTDGKVRKVFLDVSRNTMEKTLNYISANIKNLNRL